MSDAVDLELVDLHCRSRATCEEAVARIRADSWMRMHLKMPPERRSFSERDDAWRLSVVEFDGCDLSEPAAQAVARAPYPRLLSSPTRTVHPTRSQCSSSGTANLRDAPVNPRKSATVIAE